MGLVAATAGTPGGFDDEPIPFQDRRLGWRGSLDPISGPEATRSMIRAQAYLAMGASLIGLLTLVLPHPNYENFDGLLAVQLVTFSLGFWGYMRPESMPSWLPRMGPAVAAVTTTIAVIFSGDAASGYAMFYLWVGLYAFYFPGTKREAFFYVVFAMLNYVVAIVVTPMPVARDSSEIYTYFVIVAGTLAAAGILLTYLRNRAEHLISRLADTASSDPLTGLPNRAGLNLALATEFERVRADDRPASLLVLDIDRFKEVNRKHGTETGDSTLQRLSSLLENSTRLIDTVARPGGQQFAVLLPEVDKHEAYLVAEELMGEVHEVFQPPAVSITISVGIATFPAHGENPEELFEASADAVRAAKLLGRDRAVVFSPEVTRTLTTTARRDSMERQASLASALSLADALDLRDPYTARHSQTVGELCKLTARELQMPEEHVQRVRLAGLLHDIGKVGVPDAILRKPGPLTDSEWVHMRRHPELGARILSGAGLEDLRGWVLAHHERPDGNGYPKRMDAGQIPMEASVLAVCDAYEAMTADRVYRPAIGVEAACRELRDSSGTQFEPTVVDALLRVVTVIAAQAEAE
jgi:diguanylate cyclase (GGDEF)-like protein/putative nucleotidyltransferase with HDIG domain